MDFTSTRSILPFRQSEYRVNCETTSTAPPISETERFIFSSWSRKIRSPAHFAAR